MRWLVVVACLRFCQQQLFESGAPARQGCRCCDSFADGHRECELVEVTRLPPIVFTLAWPREIKPAEAPEDDRVERW